MNKKEIILVFLILFLAFVFRTYKLQSAFSFSGEFGHNLLAIKNSIETNTLPLLGPPTSHPWLHFAPFYYWLMIPIMKIFNFDPLAAAWLGGVVGTLVVFLNFYVVRKIFSKKVGILSSFFIATSPLWVIFSRNARFYFLTTLIFYPFLWSLYRFWQGDRKFLFWSGLFYGLFFSFHYSPIILLPVFIVLIFLNRKELNLKDYLNVLAGFLIPLLPLFIYDSRSGFTMTKNFLLWVPYRVAGFFGLYPKNTLTNDVFRDNILVINEFFGRSFVSESIFWPFITIFLLGFFVFMLFKLKKNSQSFVYLFLSVTIITGLAGIFVHGSSPIHYFLPLFPIPPILMAMLVTGLWRMKSLRFAIIGIIGLFPVLSIRYVLNIKTSEVAYSLQLEMSEAIVNDSQGSSFELARVGPFDYFEGDYAQNYKYLLWWKGNEPVEITDIKYTVYEGKERFSRELDEVVFEKEEVLIIKETKNGEEK